jgi:hypothetical protein
VELEREPTQACTSCCLDGESAPLGLSLSLWRVSSSMVVVFGWGLGCKGRAPSRTRVSRRVSTLNDAIPWSMTEAALPLRSSEVRVVMSKMGCSPSGPKLSQHFSERDVRRRLASTCRWEGSKRDRLVGKEGQRVEQPV